MKCIPQQITDFVHKTRAVLPFSGFAVACFLIVGIKLAFFIVDPQPQFFLDDSMSYIHTAVNGGIPADRSFVYGFLIRYLTLAGHSLTPLVFTQIISSTAVALLVYYAARNFFAVTTPLAIVATCCCALDPMQLFYERAVMTETFSTFVFATCLILAFDYTAKPRLFKVVILAMSCTVLISLRITFLPSILVICFLPPLYLLLSQKLHHTRDLQSKSKFTEAGLKPNKMTFYRYFTHLAVMVACLGVLHIGYKRLNGWLLNREPEYMHTDGLFMIAGLAPVIAPSDAPDPRFAKAINNCDPAILQNVKFRDRQRFCPGYLVAELAEAVPDPRECNALAKEDGTKCHAAPTVNGCVVWLQRVFRLF